MLKCGKRQIGLVVFLTLTFFAFSSAMAARKNVRISEQNWTGSTVICHVMKYVLENKLDIPVKIMQLNGAATWAGMTKNDVDVFSEIWETAESEGLEKFAGPDGPVAKTLSYAKAPMGWYIPKYVSDKHDIKSIEDLKGKEDIFDINSNGKGDIWVGPSSWKVAEQNKIRIRDYGLELEPNGVEQWAWLATLKEAYKKERPVIFYYWEPEWLFTQYDLVMLEEPDYSPECFQWVQGEPEKSKITCALQPSDVWVGFTKDLKTRLPRAYQFFQNWYIPIEQVNALVALVTDLPDTPKLSSEKAAEKWVNDHPDIVNDWLKGIK